MAAVVKQFIARNGLAVGVTPAIVVDATANASFANISLSGSLQTSFNLNSQILTNANIDSGTIDGVSIATSNITVGTGKTLDVSAGTLTLAADQISGDKIHGGTISGSVTIDTPYISTIYSQAATGGVLTLRSNAANVTTGYASIPMTTASTTTGTGALVVAGGLGVAGQSTLGDVVVTGNLTINGTTTTTNSTTVTIDDPVFTIGGDTAPSVDDNKDRSIEFRWYTGATPRVGFFGFDDSTGKFTFIPDATNTGEVFAGTKGTFDGYLSASDLTSGTIATGILGNSSFFLGTTSITLNQGTGTVTSLAGMTSVSSTLFTGALTGNASTSTKLAATVNINGVAFDGSGSVTIPVNSSDDLATATSVYPLWTTGAGNVLSKTSTSRLSFVPSTGILTATGFVGSATGLTSIPAGQLTGTIPSLVLGNSVHFIGTTSIALNRASLAQTLTGVSIDGNAATATALTPGNTINGVTFTGAAAITVPVNSTDDLATASIVYPLWTTATGNTAAKVSSTKLQFIPSTGVLTATGFAGVGTGLTVLPAGELTGTIPGTVLGNSTLYVGTTAITLNRGSAAMSLTGIDGITSSAVTVALFNTTATTINFGGAATAINLGASGSTTTLNGTTDSTTTGTGSLVVAGGVGIDKNIFVGGALQITGASSNTDAKMLLGGNQNSTSATISLLSVTTAMTGGGSTTLMYGANFAHLVTPATSLTQYVELGLVPTFGGGMNITNSFGVYSQLALYAGSLGGTITNHIGVNVPSPSYDASATKMVTTYTGLNIGGYTKGAGQASEPTNVYGIRSSIASATGRYNLFIDGTADNRLNGSLGVGKDPTLGAVDVNGSVAHKGLVMTAGVAGAIAVDQSYQFTMASTALTTTWIATGVDTELVTGVYMVYLQAGTNEFYSGIMSWNSVNGASTILDDTSEIPLVKASDGSTITNVYLRVQRLSYQSARLQISASASLAAYAYVINFRRIW